MYGAGLLKLLKSVTNKVFYSLSHMDFKNLTNQVANATVNWTVNDTSDDKDDLAQGVFFKLRMSVLLLIVIMAVLGNMLVIVSVMRHR